MNINFLERKSVFEVEEGLKFQPKFDENGLIPVITSNASDNNILMHGYMNKEALSKSIKTGYVHYWSRSRRCLWEKGKTSGLKQEIIEIKVDDDQDCLWFSVKIPGIGASCHVGYKSCFYRKISLDKSEEQKLVFTENKKVFDPKKVYGNAPNPTKL